MEILKTESDQELTLEGTVDFWPIIQSTFRDYRARPTDVKVYPSLVKITAQDRRRIWIHNHEVIIADLLPGYVEHTYTFETHLADCHKIIASGQEASLNTIFLVFKPVTASQDTTIRLMAELIQIGAELALTADECDVYTLDKYIIIRLWWD